MTAEPSGRAPGAWRLSGEARTRNFVRDHGWLPPEDELPDFLPLLLEFAARSPEPGLRLLAGPRQPQGGHRPMAHAPFVHQLHAALAMALLALWPFSRLVHAFSAPLG
ncbi:respiratory nitrate reductase subunit gamma [Streptomyces sp. NPDC053560]|uniref:respiratory nitrate reductase subunit gamma n=1 Tax=Streptomyces sp. NPDC053560 TaxID=3365711 RepID=UPI0037D82010